MRAGMTWNELVRLQSYKVNRSDNQLFDAMTEKNWETRKLLAEKDLEVDRRLAEKDLEVERRLMETDLEKVKLLAEKDLIIASLERAIVEKDSFLAWLKEKCQCLSTIKNSTTKILRVLLSRAKLRLNIVESLLCVVVLMGVVVVATVEWSCGRFVSAVCRRHSHNSYVAIEKLDNCLIMVYVI